MDGQESGRPTAFGQTDERRKLTSKHEEEERQSKEHERSHDGAGVEDLSCHGRDEVELGEDGPGCFAELDERESGEAGGTTGDEGSVGLMSFEEAGCHHAEHLKCRTSKYSGEYGTG